MYATTRAVTLIELMVVIGIIALLAVLIVPVIQRASARTLQTECMANLRQIGMGLRQYTLINSYHLPHATRRPSAPPIGEEAMPGIAEVLEPFLDNMEVMHCPADYGGFFAAEKSSYEWNSLLNGKPVGREKLVIVGVSYEVPLMADYEPYHIGSSESGKNFLRADGAISTSFLKP